MTQVQLQFKRLQRHYEHSVKTYDNMSLLDLVHTLRIWTELKAPLADKYNNVKIKKIFITGSPVRKLLQKIENYQYVLSYLQKDGVTTYASNGELASGSIIEDKSKFSMGIKVKNTGTAILLSQYCYVSSILQPTYLKAMRNERISFYNYSDWLGSETVRLQFLNSERVFKSFTITREMLIKRVANILDASHTSLNNESANNKYDEPIKWLMNFKCGGLPLPYFLLLKIAQDILSNVPELLINEKE